jgi:hypothetical protein
MSEGWLTIVLEHGERRHVRLDLSVTTIGRSEQNVIDLPDSRLSRFHCEIHKRGDAFVLRDCGSRNGTRLNTDELEAEADLKAGDVIEIGRARMTFAAERPAELARDDQRWQPIPKLRSNAQEADTPASSLRRDVVETPAVEFDPRTTQPTPNPFPRPATAKTPVAVKSASAVAQSVALELARAISRSGPQTPPSLAAPSIAAHASPDAVGAAWDDLVPAGKGTGREVIVAVLASASSPVRAAADLAATRAALRALAPFGQRSDALLTGVSAALSPELQGRLVPLTLARIDLASGAIVLAGGGLGALIWRAASKSIETLAKLGSALGEQSPTWGEKSIELADGDVLVLAAPALEPVVLDLNLAASGAETLEKLAQALGKSAKDSVVVLIRR